MPILSDANPHDRDLEISFREDGHIYTVQGDTGFTSVTTWNHSHFKEFNADAIIASMMSRESWPSSKYYGKSPDEIKALWDANRDAAAVAGRSCIWTSNDTTMAYRSRTTALSPAFAAFC